MTKLHAHPPQVLVLGGGIIGLSIGWSLASHGCRVDVIDAGRQARQGGRDAASWASAGLLAVDVHDEPVDDDLRRLCLRSRDAWPAFAARLEQASGVWVDRRTRGTLVAALSDDECAHLEAVHARHEALGARQEWLTATAARRREPGLSDLVRAARYLPDDVQVDPRAVLVALRDALQLAGGVLHAATVDEVKLDGDRPVLLGEGWRREADFLVIAAGAWTRDLHGVPSAWRRVVRPVKGQMLAVERADGAPLLEHAVFTGGGYLVPRTSGRLLVGATVEECDFEPGVTAGGLAGLLDHARRAVPAIGSARVVESWFGFRPATTDGAPLIGFRDERVVFATGHHRNGILLAPATAEAVTDAILRAECPAWSLPFAPDRLDAPLATTR